MTETATNPLLQMDPAALRAFMQQASAVLKDADQDRREEYSTLGKDFFAHVVENSVFTESPTSDWAGFTERGIEIEHNDRKYSISFTVTDTARKGERKEGTKEQAQADSTYYVPRKKKDTES